MISEIGNKMTTAAVGLAVLIAGYAFIHAGPTAAKTGTITYHSGEVRVQRGSERLSVSSLEEDRFVYPGDIITTGKDGKANIHFRSGIKLSIGPDSEFVLDEKEGNAVELQLKQGSLFSRVEKMNRQDSYTIHTPTAIASVRGTDFSVVTDPESNETTTLVDDGSVSVKTADREIVLSDGQVATATRAGFIRIEKATEEARKRVRDSVNEIREMKDSIREKFRRMKESTDRKGMHNQIQEQRSRIRGE